jgi:hypothetical protein
MPPSPLPDVTAFIECIEQMKGATSVRYQEISATVRKEG